MVERQQAKICAGIVLYNPEINMLEENIRAILPQVEALLLVDNGSLNFDEIMANWSSNNKIYVIANNINKGVACALNQICTWAEKLGFNWALTLDQDSVCSEGMISEFSKYTVCENVGIISPYVNYKNKRTVEQDLPEYEYIDRCITSASLTSVDAWKKVKGFDEWMFIDYVDLDFCMRLKLNNYRIMKINTVFLDHNLGNIEEVKLLFWIRCYPTNHSVFRNYYIVRNWIYYIRKYKLNIDVNQEITYLIKFEIKRILLEKNKIGTIKSAVRGLIDGLSAEIKDE